MPSTLLTLLDDISTILDDVATMSKVALRKTAGVVGDDLALNAQQIVGVEVNRELPVVCAVAKGSALNKLVLFPAALAISVLIPSAVLPLLMIGGAYLCYEGFEKILHKLVPGKRHIKEEHREHVEALSTPKANMVDVEKKKIRGAIRTDFILSAEIIVIALGTVSEAPFAKQVAVLASVAVLMTVCVYGLVACIIKLDDLGLHLSLAAGDGHAVRWKQTTGKAILWTAPWLMRGLSIAGTLAMFTVGGGILTHGIAPLHHGIEHVAHGNGVKEFIVPLLLNLVAGVVAGAILVGGLLLGQRLLGRGDETGEPAH